MSSKNFQAALQSSAIPSLPQMMDKEENITRIDISAGKKKERFEEATGEDSLLRSRQMSLLQIYFPMDLAKESIAAIGALSCFQFRNLNEGKLPNQFRFADEIRQIDESERRLAMLAKEMQAMQLWKLEEITQIEVDIAAAAVLDQSPPKFLSPKGPKVTPPSSLQELFDQLQEIEKRVVSLQLSEAELRERQKELVARAAVLGEAERLFDEGKSFLSEENEPAAFFKISAQRTTPEIEEEPISATPILGFVGGILAHSKSAVLEGLLWRALRGHLFMRVVEMPSNFAIRMGNTDEDAPDLFLVGANGEAALGKVRRLALSQGATVVSIGGGDTAQRAQEASKALSGLEELEGVLASTAATKRSILVNLCSSLPVWRAYILKERALYSAMNMCLVDDSNIGSPLKNDRKISLPETEKTATPESEKSLIPESLSEYESATSFVPVELHTLGGGCLVAEGWAPTGTVGVITRALERARVKTGAPIPAFCSELCAVPLDGQWPQGVQPLSLTPPTAFTTNKYTSSFQDIINAYGVPTYGEINPALFTLITFPFLFAIMFGDAGHGVIVLMAASFMIYREKQLKISPPMGGDIWDYVFNGRYIIFLMGLWSVYIGFLYNDWFSKCMNVFGSGWLWIVGDAGESAFPVQTGVPWFGIDPAWLTAENALTFLNSYKTKQALLLGLIQMYFGLAISAFNFKFRKDSHSFYGLFIPQLLFLSATFGYLGLLFILKWLIQTPASPSLLMTFVDMFLSPGSINPAKQLYRGQGFVQVFLLLVAFICVPWMLLYRPIALWIERKDGRHVVVMHNDESEEEEEGFSFGNEFMHSAIHTIEFCLASISNTASYLRLWALSLAHSQLSEVLWDLIAENAASTPWSGVPIFVIWFSLTLSILVGMEGLSAFLHALRLHWVEFNNKFFQGEGVEFEPLSLPSLLSPAAIRAIDPNNEGGNES